MSDPQNAEYQRRWRERQAGRLAPVQRQACSACPRLHTGTHGTLCWRCWRRLTPEGLRYVADSTAQSKARRKAAVPPALALIGALLLTGCSGTLWGLPLPSAPRRTPDHFRGATQMVAATAGSAAQAAQLQPLTTQSPADVPTPAGLPVLIAAWWWSRRLRDCDRP